MSADVEAAPRDVEPLVDAPWEPPSPRTSLTKLSPSYHLPEPEDESDLGGWVIVSVGKGGLPVVVRASREWAAIVVGEEGTVQLNEPNFLATAFSTENYAKILHDSESLEQTGKFGPVFFHHNAHSMVVQGCSWANDCFIVSATVLGQVLGGGGEEGLPEPSCGELRKCVVPMMTPVRAK